MAAWQREPGGRCYCIIQPSSIQPQGFLGEVFAPCPHLAQFLSIRVRQQRFEGLEAGIDALHATPLVAVGNLTADSPLLVLSRLGAEGNVG